MQRHPLCGVVIVSAFAVFGLWGCGQSGSDPIQYPEVRIAVQPSGQATFSVDRLIAGGVSYTTVIGQTFPASAAFNFVLENAPPPFEAAFTLVSGDRITVTLTVVSGSGQTQVTDSTGEGKHTAIVRAGGTLSATPVPSNPEVRFDVCAVSPGESACSTTTDPGIFGLTFTGSIGDPFTSHLLNGTTPSIYFFQAPRDNVNSVFTLQPITGNFLVSTLFIDGTARQSEVSTGKVIISQDL